MDSEKIKKEGKGKTGEKPVESYFMGIDDLESILRYPCYHIIRS